MQYKDGSIIYTERDLTDLFILERFGLTVDLLQRIWDKYDQEKERQT